MKDFLVVIRAGGIVNKHTVRKVFDALKDGDYFVTIRTTNIRSAKQNAFYWGCMIPLVRAGLIDAGFNEIISPDDAHNVIKDMFLRKEMTNENGVKISKSNSTQDLTTVEFNELIQHVQIWASDFLSVIIPDPNTQMTLL